MRLQRHALLRLEPLVAPKVSVLSLWVSTHKEAKAEEAVAMSVMAYHARRKASRVPEPETLKANTDKA